MKNHFRAGFSLLEMAIVLIILGIILGAGVPYFKQSQAQSRLKETKNRQEQIVQAIASYVLLHDELPCPARMDAEVGQHGVSAQDCADVPSAIGMVPYFTLGLSESTAKDGYNQWMIYVVPPHMHSHGPVLGRQNREPMICRLRVMETIVLKDKNNRLLGTKWQDGRPDPDDYIAALLISTGGSHGGDVNQMERTNLDASLNFYDLPFGVKSGSFGHMVKWVTLRNLMGVYAQRPCQSLRTGEDDVHVEPRSPLGDPFGRGD